MTSLPEFMQASASTEELAKTKKEKAPFDIYLLSGFVLIFTLITSFLAWSVLAPIQGAVIAPGSVVVEGKPKTIQHLVGGVVGEIFVEDGDKVKQGDVVMRLDPTSLLASQNLLQKRLNEMSARVARLKAERDGRRSVDWSSIFSNNLTEDSVRLIINDQTELLKTRRDAYFGQVNQFEKQIEQSGEQMNGLKSQIQSNTDQIAIIATELDGLRELLEQGYVSQARVLGLEREQTSLEGQVSSLKSEIARIKTSIGEIEIQILQVKRTQQESVLTELRASESELSDLTEQLVAAENDVKQIDIVAPVSGTVHNMTITTLGGVVTPANPIMDIIPDAGLFVIESQVEPAAIDQIFIGQATTVRLSAFNQRTTPELNGNVSAISANTLVDPITALPYYTVKITIPKVEMERLNGLTLVPGMPAEAFMQTDKRSAMNYLLKPATDQLNRAFREE